VTNEDTELSTMALPQPPTIAAISSPAPIQQHVHIAAAMTLAEDQVQTSLAAVDISVVSDDESDDSSNVSESSTMTAWSTLAQPGYTEHHERDWRGVDPVQSAAVAEKWLNTGPYAPLDEILETTPNEPPIEVKPSVMHVSIVSVALIFTVLGSRSGSHFLSTRSTADSLP
jgi:hypothetical protein